MPISAQRVPNATPSVEPAPKWIHDGTMATEGEVLELLFALVRNMKPRRCVETGTYAGHGARAISNALVANDYGYLTSIESDPEIAAKLAQVELPRTTWAEADSFEWAQEAEGPFEFAFIDCGEPEHRAKVAVALQPKVSGLIVVHDTDLYPSTFLTELTRHLGPARIHLPTLHGVTIWEV